MGWFVSFETTSHDDLHKHVDAFVKSLHDEAQAKQVPLAFAQVVAMADALGAAHYLAILSGNANPAPGEGDSLSVSVVRRPDDAAKS